MFEEANRESFDGWVGQLINGGLENMSTIRDFEWRDRLSASNFDLIKRLQQCLNLTDDILISGLCYMKRTAGTGLKLTDTSIYK